MPTVEFQITVDRRELASIRAALRLLQWFAGPDARNVPFNVARDVVDIEGPGEPLTAAEIADLVRRLA